MAVLNNLDIITLDSYCNIVIHMAIINMVKVLAINFHKALAINLMVAKFNNFIMRVMDNLIYILVLLNFVEKDYYQFLLLQSLQDY